MHFSAYIAASIHGAWLEEDGHEKLGLERVGASWFVLLFFVLLLDLTWRAWLASRVGSASRHSAFSIHIGDGILAWHA